MQMRTPALLEELGLARGYAVSFGIVLVVIGVLGFVDNPIIGDPAANPLFVTGTVHNMVHLATGFLGLYVAFALVGREQADAIIGLGAFYLVMVLLTLLSPNLFGILGPSPGYNVNALDHVLHLALGIASVAVGVIARRQLAAE